MNHNRYQHQSVSPLSGSPLISEAIAEECSKIRCKSGEGLDRASLQRELGLPSALPIDRVFFHKEDVPLSANLRSKYVPEENLVSPEETYPEVEEDAPEFLSPKEAMVLKTRARRFETAMASRPSEFAVCGETDNRIVCAFVDAKNMTITYVSDSRPKRTFEDEPLPASHNTYIVRNTERRPQSSDNENRCQDRLNMKTLPECKRQRIFRGEIRTAIGKW